MCGFNFHQALKRQAIVIMLGPDESIISIAPINPKLNIPVKEIIVQVVADNSVGPKRNIHFSPLVEIRFIPCLAEYRDANILPSMYWTNDDLKTFRTEVLRSLVNYLATVPEGTDKKLALRDMIKAEASDAPSETIFV